MTTTIYTPDDLDRATAHLCAIALPDGRYAYWAGETGRYYTLTAAALASLAGYLTRADSSGRIGTGGYSEWCADVDSDEMPSWYDPEHSDHVHCECGEWSGEACEWTGPVAETVVVEWMPESLRETHIAAGQAGSWPHNGSVRSRVERTCADRMIEYDGEWADIVTGR